MQACLTSNIVILVQKSSYLFSEWTMLLADVELYVCRAKLSFELAEHLASIFFFFVRADR